MSRSSHRTNEGTPALILLIDIGNTHTHIGLAHGSRITRHCDLLTAMWRTRTAGSQIKRFVGPSPPEHAALCSVVPNATPHVVRAIRQSWDLPVFELNAKTLRGVGLNYPRPQTIGPDRLANAVAVRHHFGCPAVAVDFGTAVTFDVVDPDGDYAGGIIAPGLAALTEYLHEKTALLPKIKIREVNSIVGKTTEEAMVIGAVHGYRGLVRQLITELKQQLQCADLPVVATGGYAKLISAKVPEITAVEPLLTLEGLRLELEQAK